MKFGILESSSGKIANDDLNDADGYKFLKSAFENFHSAMTKNIFLDFLGTPKVNYKKFQNSMESGVVYDNGTTEKSNSA